MLPLAILVPQEDVIEREAFMEARTLWPGQKEMVLRLL